MSWSWPEVLFTSNFCYVLMMQSTWITCASWKPTDTTATLATTAWPATSSPLKLANRYHSYSCITLILISLLFSLLLLCCNYLNLFFLSNISVQAAVWFCWKLCSLELFVELLKCSHWQVHLRRKLKSICENQRIKILRWLTVCCSAGAIAELGWK